MCHFADNVVRCLVAASLLLSLLPAVPASAASLASASYQTEALTVTPEPVAPETPPPGAEPPATNTPAPPDTATTPPETPTSLPAETATLPSEETGVPVETATASPPPAETATVPPVGTPAPEETATPAPTDPPAPTPTATFTPKPEATLRTSANDQAGRTVYLPLVLKAAVPQAAFSSPRPAGPAPLSVTFVHSSTHATSLVWDFGDGSAPLVVTIAEDMVATSTTGQPALGPTHVYTQAGVYTVTLQAGNGVVTDTFTQANYITPFQLNVPRAKFAGTPLSGSRPLTVTFDNLSSAASEYVWDFGDTLTSTAISPSHAYTQVGVYTVSLVARAGALSDVLTRTAYVTVSEAIAAGFTAEPLRGRVPLTVTLSNLSTNATAYTWDFGDGTTSTEISPSHVYTRPGVYTVTLVAGDGVVSDTLAQPGLITVSDVITVDFSAFPTSGPAPLAIQFLDGSMGAENYRWDFGDSSGVTSSQPSPTHTYTLPGVYTVNLTVSDNVTEATEIKPGYITVLEPVVPGFWAEPVSGTVPLAVTFDNTSTGATDAVWEFGTGATLTAISPTYTYHEPGVYTVTLTAIGPGGRETLVQTGAITAYAPVAADFEASVLVGTAPLTVTFANSSTLATAYLWDFGDTTTSTVINPTHIYTRPGVYTVTLTAGDGVLTDTVVSSIEVIDQDTLGAGLPADPGGLLFIENVGQFDPRARFMVRGATGALYLANDALWFTVLENRPEKIGDQEKSSREPGNPSRRGVNFKLSFPGANPHARIEPFNRLETTVSYFTGSDPDGWRPDVPVWGGVRYVDFYPGMDLEISSQGGELVQRLVVRQTPGILASKAPSINSGRGPSINSGRGPSINSGRGPSTNSGRGPSINSGRDGESWGQDVRMRVEGTEGLALERGRALRLSTAIGDFSLPLLQVVDADGAPLELAPEAPKVTGDEISAPFAPAASASAPAIVTARVAGLASPLPLSLFAPLATGAADLVYSTFLGGSSDDYGYDLAVDNSGNVYITGETASSGFPATTGAFDTGFGGVYDGIVAKVNADGTGLVYATFLGGSNNEESYAIAIDGSGNAYVTGSTQSSSPYPAFGFPTTVGAFDRSHGGNRDAFVTKLNSAGTGLVYSTFLGSGSDEYGYDIAVDGNGNAYVTGSNASSSFPTTEGAFDRTRNAIDAFVTQLNSDGTGLVYSTFLGGSSNDYGLGIAIDSSGSAYVTGFTTSANFPLTAGAFDGNYAGTEAFVTKMNSSGTGLAYSSYLGGSGDDYGYAITVDSSGNAYLTGQTSSSSADPALRFPTTDGAFDTSFGGATDAFVTKVNGGGTGLAYSTFLGGGSDEEGTAIAVDGSGNAYVTGVTASSGFPTTEGAFDTSFGGAEDAFVTKVNAIGAAPLIYSTLLGGSSDDYGYGIAIDGSGNAYVTGFTSSSNFPTTAGAFDEGHNGSYDAFVSKLALTMGPLPLAIFSAQPLLGATPLTVTFTNNSIGATGYWWDYGDGVTSTITATTHVYTYTQAGVYTVTLTASDGITSHTQTRPAYITAVLPAAFPTTGILDDFNRANGAIGGNWSGMTTGFSLVSNQLDVNSGENYIYWNPASFGTDQEAYVSLAQMDQSGTSVNLLLKFRPDGSGVIAVAYDWGGQRILVGTYDSSQDWVQRGADIPVTLANGDQLGARATAGGQVEVYRNGELLAIRDVTAWPYYADGGYIGLFSINSAVAVLDDFGGGTVVETQTPVAAFSADPVAGPAPLAVTFSNSSTNATEYVWHYGDGVTSTITATTHVYTYTQAGIYTVTLIAGDGITTDTLTRTNYITVTDSLTAAFPTTGILDDFNRANGAIGGDWSGQQWGYSISATKLDVGQGGQIYWNPASFGANQEVYVTLTSIDPDSAEIDLLLKSQSSTGFYDGVLEIWYEPTGQRILVGTYDSSQGWVQHGADIPVTFSAGDRFGARATAAGQVEVYQNDTLLAIRDVTAWPYYANGGYIGLWFINSDTSVLDDFGGGTVVESQAPVAAFAASPLAGPAPFSVTFSNSSIGATGYLWAYGDGITSTIAATSHVYTYTQPGVYTVTLTASSAGDSDTLVRPAYITVTDTAIEGLAAINDNPTILGETTTLTVTISAGSNVSYDWAFGDGQSGSGAVVTHTYSQTGTYTAIVTASNPVSVVTATTVVTITGSADLAISKAAPSTAVAGEPVTYTLTITNSGAGPAANLLITDTLPISSYYVSGGDLAGDVVSWTVPALAGGEAISVTFTVTAATTITNSDYAVTADGGISAVGQEPVTTLVYPPVIVDFTADPLIGTIPLTVTFTNNSGGATGYLWDFGDSITSTVISPTHVYTRAGVYTVSLAAGNGIFTETLTRTGYITVTELITRDWQVITTATTLPPVVGEHGLAYDSGRGVVVLYGGNADGWPYENTTWEFDGTDWISVTTTTTPAARYGAGLAYDAARGLTVLFGGSDETDTALAQTWEYSGTDWIEADQVTSPPARTYPCLAADPISGTIYLFGGNDGEQAYDDLWHAERDSGEWTEIPITGDKPSPRTLAAMTYVSSPPPGGTEGGYLLLFGGRSLTGTILADLWAFEPISATWTLLDDGGDGSPPPRMAHSLTYDPVTGNAVLIGGIAEDGETLLGDTWHYNGSWREASPETALPARAYHRSVYGDDALILFSTGEVWRYE